MDISYIYILVDPITKHIRYVGQSVKPKKRLSDHISFSKNHDTSYDHVHNWIKSMLKKNRIPIMIVIDECNVSKIDDLEKYYIAYYKNKGYKLTNILNGGQGKFSYSTAAIERMRINSTKIRTIYGIDIKNQNVTKYDSTTDVCIQLGWVGRQQGKVKKCCDGINKTMKGFIFVWEKDFDKSSIEDIIKERIKNIQHKQVLQYDSDGNLIAEHISLSRAAKSINTHPVLISNCCNNKPKYKSVKNFQWRWKNDKVSKKIKPLYRNNSLYPIIQCDISGSLIAEYKNSAEASRKTGIGYSSIINCCNGDRQHASGFIWVRK